MADIKVFKRNKDELVKLSKNFSAREFFCQCGKCEDQLIDLEHVKKLQKLREDFDSPITITSAYRCPEHNAKVGGASNSQHKLGTATDIQIEGVTPYEVQDACEHFDGLGRYDTFTHVDSRGTRARWDERKRAPEYLPQGPSEEEIEKQLEEIEKDILGDLLDDE